MKIIFPDKDYALSLIFANIDTLQSRHEQLTEQFFGRTVCSTEIVLPALPAPGQTGLSHYRQITSRKNIQIIDD